MSKENVVIIPGLHYHKKGYSKMIKGLSNYHVYFFDWNSDKSTEKVVNDLTDFMKKNHILKTNFITHSYGSVIFRLFYGKNKKAVGKVVEVAPLNKHSKLLEKFHDLFPNLLSKFLGKGYVDFISKTKEILDIDLPKGLGIIAGNKRFNPWRWEFYIIPFFHNTIGSDGKVFVNETKDKMMGAFSIVHDTHSRLVGNDEVISKINNFFKKLKFD